MAKNFLEPDLRDRGGKERKHKMAYDYSELGYCGEESRFRHNDCAGRITIERLYRAVMADDLRGLAALEK